MAKKRVVLTGACGYVAQRMIEALGQRYDLVCLDVSDETSDGTSVPGVRIADLTDPDRDAYREHFRGAEAVVHCAFVRAPDMDAGSWQANTDAKFRAEHANVAMAYNVYRVAQEEAVKRVVVASSNHAADYYERLIWADKLELVTPDMRLSDNYYGWAKAAYELLGFVFASGRVPSGRVGGGKLEVVQWRIGAPREGDLDDLAAGDIKVMHRALGAYLSARDQAQQAVRMIEAADIEDENGVPFLVVYGISGNTHRFWSLTNAFDKIGYAPEDDSQVRFAERIAEIAREKPE
jgi:hypothetical protein